MTGIVPVALRGEPTPTYELALRAKDGTRVEMLFNATARRDATGAIVGLLGVGQVCDSQLPLSHSLSLALAIFVAPFSLSVCPDFSLSVYLSLSLLIFLYSLARSTLSYLPPSVFTPISACLPSFLPACLPACPAASPPPRFFPELSRPCPSAPLFPVASLPSPLYSFLPSPHTSPLECPTPHIFRTICSPA